APTPLHYGTTCASRGSGMPPSWGSPRTIPSVRPSKRAACDPICGGRPPHDIQVPPSSCQNGLNDTTHRRTGYAPPKELPRRANVVSPPASRPIESLEKVTEPLLILGQLRSK